jgi:CheY-like chemotaxis protein
MGDDDTLGDALRHALNHLHDPQVLGTSPLIAWLGLEELDDPPRALRGILEQAIADFQPVAGSPCNSRGQRHYQVLLGRYVEQLTQDAVALRLGITTRHLRREQVAALQALEDYLRLRYDLPRGVQPDLMPEGAPAGPSIVEPQTAELNREMLWLADSLRDRTSEVEPVLREALDLATAYAEQRSISMSLSCPSALPQAAVPSTVLRQIVLNLLTTAIRSLLPGGRIRLFAQVESAGIAIVMSATEGDRRAWRLLGSLDPAVSMSRRLTELFEGELTVTEVDNLLIARAVLPPADRRVTILAIEDNLDTTRLWQRYVQGTLFDLVQQADPEQALERAELLQPDIIILDIMLPSIDGWELLRELRHHPATCSIPIIICTVLPQADLALALGASDFIQKPATGREFRAVLQRQIVAAARPPGPPQTA